MNDGIEHLSKQHFRCVKTKHFTSYNGLDMQNNIKRQQSNCEVRCRSFRVKEVLKEIKSLLQYMQIFVDIIDKLMKVNYMGVNKQANWLIALIDLKFVCSLFEVFNKP